MSKEPIRKRISLTMNNERVLVVYLDSIASVRKELNGAVITTVGGHKYKVKFTVDEIMKKIEEIEAHG